MTQDLVEIEWIFCSKLKIATISSNDLGDTDRKVFFSFRDVGLKKQGFTSKCNSWQVGLVKHRCF